MIETNTMQRSTDAELPLAHVWLHDFYKEIYNWKVIGNKFENPELI